ncbi:hypothetical protein LZ31DRAFT_274708 [Colletotrichum somersetense]|nr:hypothetical protein LZ31DRAFT_274708 [Colletotrichum somersetense]
MFPSAASGQSLPGFTTHTPESSFAFSLRPGGFVEQLPYKGVRVDRLANRKEPPRETRFAGYNPLMRGRFEHGELGSKTLGHSQTCPPACCILQAFFCRRALKLQPQSSSHFHNLLSYDDGNTEYICRIWGSPTWLQSVGSRTSWQQPLFDRLAELSVPLAAAPSRCHFVDWCWAEPTPNSAQLRELLRPLRSILATNLSLGASNLPLSANLAEQHKRLPVGTRLA